MACPGGCIGGAGQPQADWDVKAERAKGIYLADKEYKLKGTSKYSCAAILHRLLPHLFGSNAQQKSILLALFAFKLQQNPTQSCVPLVFRVTLNSVEKSPVMKQWQDLMGGEHALHSPVASERQSRSTGTFTTKDMDTNSS
ncbi:MAG: hypothetical protein Ta2G_01040 [Termitinemataceae bacterium]|nr:MAG: hypothetical protein Ta2G_01040 [Termitinemataceae bacterium]